MEKCGAFNTFLFFFWLAAVINVRYKTNARLEQKRLKANGYSVGKKATREELQTSKKTSKTCVDCLCIP